jgi:hypothetical protein
VRGLLVLVLVTGCDALFRLTEVPPADTSMADGGAGDSTLSSCFLDTFTGTNAELDLTWHREPGSAFCQANIKSNELVFEHAANQACLVDVRLIGRRSFVGARMTVELVGIPEDGPIETFFGLELDSQNYYTFDYTSGKLKAAVAIDNVQEQIQTWTYTSSHRFLRIQHRPETSQLDFLTSADGAVWAKHHTTSTPVAIETLEAVIGASTYGGGVPTPQTSRFDSFELCIP